MSFFGAAMLFMVEGGGGGDVCWPKLLWFESLPGLGEAESSVALGVCVGRGPGPHSRFIEELKWRLAPFHADSLPAALSVIS